MCVASAEALPAAAPRSQLPFLEAILLETMRVLPPAYMIGRCAREDSALGEWRVPRGTTILVGCVLMHRCAVPCTRRLLLHIKYIPYI